MKFQLSFIFADAFLNSQSCIFTITVQDKQPPTILCSANFEVQIPTGATVAVVNWQTPIANDNVAVESITQSIAQMSNVTAGIHTVEAYCNDTSGNISPRCFFNITVLPPFQAQSAGSSASAGIAGGAGGGIAGLLLVGLLIVAIWSRRQRILIHKLESQYGNSADMSDEAVLARAQAIQQALQNKKRNAAPNMKWLQVPPVNYKPPPKDMGNMAKYFSGFSDIELDRATVVIESEIGAGEFGSVCSGFHKRRDGTKRTIAIKTLKDASAEENKAKFLQEASIMIQFKHPKIVALVGIVTKGEPVLICLEFMELGSLRNYLKSELVMDQLADYELLRMACDVCSAMHYLGESGFIHRDLAARNVLVNKEFVCKVCDFGLSQEAGIVSVKDEKIPIRWTAPEAVVNGQFSTASDVWSFGIFMWELWSYGAMPYKGWTNEVVMAQVTKGFRMPAPSNCPAFIHSLMLECWNEDEMERPSFFDIFQRLIAAWNIVKPISSSAKVVTYDESGNKIIKAKASAAMEFAEDDDAEAYDLGGTGGKFKVAQADADEELEAAKRAQERNADDEEDENAGMYDLGGKGGTIQAEALQDELFDVDEDMFGFNAANALNANFGYMDEEAFEPLTDRLQITGEALNMHSDMAVADAAELPSGYLDVDAE